MCVNFIPLRIYIYHCGRYDELGAGDVTSPSIYLYSLHQPSYFRAVVPFLI